MPESCVAVFRSLAELSADARKLFGGEAFSTLGWYESVERAALPTRAQAAYAVVTQRNDVLAVVPMLRDRNGLSALSTPYTVQWRPLLRDGLAEHELVAVGAACGRLWRRGALTRLDAMDASAGWLAPFLAGMRRAGLVPLRFDHFANWHENVAGQGWRNYLASRPGALRSAVARRGKRLTSLGASFTLVAGLDGLDAGLAAYEHVYSLSWKQPEPFPVFNAALMRAAAVDGSLRLGLLHLDGIPIAAQFWLVHGGWAGVQKLAHDEAHRALAPGTALTALMLEHLLEQDGAQEIDFGRGDDAYKRDWAGQRRQRVGVVLAAPWHPAGAAAIARHVTGHLARWGRRLQTMSSSGRSTASQA